MDIDRLQVIAILRDWQKSKAVNSNSYPQAQVHVVEIPMWSREEQFNFITERVSAHQDAFFEHDIDGSLPECSDADRWKRDSVWAVCKIGGVRSVKNFNSFEEANLFFNNMKTNEGYEVVERKGEPARCVGNYCQVAPFCEQYQREM